MLDLFDYIESGPPRPVANDIWRPEAPPRLTDVHDIYLNFETTGLRWFEHDLPLALTVATEDRSWYLPFGHAGCGNLDETQVYRFAQSLRGKHITNINTRFEVHMGREWGRKMGSGGLDFEEMGCTVSDVGHYVALLDDHRFHMNLDSLIQDFLKEMPMQRLDESRMASYSAGSAQARARYNVECVKRLKAVLWPKLDAEGLQKVRQLEDEVIYVVCEMEKNGTLLNVELLEQWIKDTRNEYTKCLMQLYKETGLKINPNSSKDQAKLFRYLKIPFLEFTDKGAPSFTDDILKHIPHSTVKLLRHSKKMASLNSKLRKYKDSVDSNGILRYAMHQMRASKDESEDSGETGTVVGRFTSTEIVDGVGVNIQQVLNPEKQILTFGDEFFIRDLHIPPPGLQYLSVDAAQLQYRIFAHEADNPKVLAAYKEDPWMSFHKYMLKELRKYKPDITYKRTKDTNFAKIFVAGLAKLSLMLEFITKKEFLELKAQHAGKTHPKLAKALEIVKIYAREIPEADMLQKRYSYSAERQGYITSLLGRRMRFPFKERLHKALNGRIIMSEADIVKTKAVELHKARKDTNFTMCFQVHDEFDGYIPDQQHADTVDEILNTQSFPELRVPILWDTKVGTSWGDTAKDELEQIRKDMHL